MNKHFELNTFHDIKSRKNIANTLCGLAGKIKSVIKDQCRDNPANQFGIDVIDTDVVLDFTLSTPTGAVHAAFDIVQADSEDKQVLGRYVFYSSIKNEDFVSVRIPVFALLFAADGSYSFGNVISGRAAKRGFQTMDGEFTYRLFGQILGNVIEELPKIKVNTALDISKLAQKPSV